MHLAQRLHQSAIGSLLARIEVFDTLQAAEAAWRALEAGNALKTPYQGFDFVSAWQQHVGEPSGMTPMVIAAFDAGGAPVALLPLGRRRAGPFKMAEFFGGSHSNFNLGLWRQDAAAAFDAGMVRQFVDAAAASADALVLTHQPMSWNGVANPMALLPHTTSVNKAYRGTLMPDFEELLRTRASGDTRKKMRKKARGLAQRGAIEFLLAGTPETKRAALDAFFLQKRERMQEIGLPDVFSAPDVRAFIEQTVFSGEVELYALSVGGTIIAAQGGLVRDGRFSAMFISMIGGDWRADSPGEQILLHLMRACCERGLHTLDLGVGGAAYKATFAPDEEPLFDSYLPLTPVGKLIALAAQTAGGLKRTIKQTPALWSAVETARRLRGRLATS